MTTRQAHPEVVRECGEDGTGWRINEYGDWWPCGELVPLLTIEEKAEKRRRDAEAEKEADGAGRSGGEEGGA